MKLRFFALMALLLSSVSALADGKMFTCSVFETNERGQVSVALYTRGVPLMENGNASIAFDNEYLSYRMTVSQNETNSAAQVDVAFRSSDGGKAFAQSVLDLKQRSEDEIRLIVNSYKPDGNFVSEIRLACSVQ